MTPKEKAQELINTMLSCNPNRQDGISAIDTIQAKLCAGKAVDEILKVVSLTDSGYGEETTIQYWEEVKQEIEKI